MHVKKKYFVIGIFVYLIVSCSTQSIRVKENGIIFWCKSRYEFWLVTERIEEKFLEEIYIRQVNEVQKHNGFPCTFQRLAFKIVYGASRTWKQKVLNSILYSCIVRGYRRVGLLNIAFSNLIRICKYSIAWTSTVFGTLTNCKCRISSDA